MLFYPSYGPIRPARGPGCSLTSLTTWVRRSRAQCFAHSPPSNPGSNPGGVTHSALRIPVPMGPNPGRWSHGVVAVDPWLCWMSDIGYQTTLLLLYPPDDRILGFWAHTPIPGIMPAKSHHKDGPHAFALFA